MASAAMNAVAHSAPSPYAISMGPRVRPPRLLPGTKADNTNPQPPGPVPENAVWVQGKWRNPASNAAKDRQSLQSKQVEKALRHHTHGMNIYAYRQIRTNQIVYSLTRVMQNTKILPQLVYHRKKTVPAALRRDVWRPYFSIHFPQTPAGAQAGLRAYQYLRELALKRQLSPPPSMLIATEEDVEKARKRTNPINLRDKLQSHQLRDLPRLNQLLPAKWRAKKLMDQTATSVADASFVLSVLNVDQNPTERLTKIEENRIQRHKERTPRDRRRINQLREREQITADKIEERQQMLQLQPGQGGLDRHALERVAIEYGGAITGKGAIGGLQDIQSVIDATAEANVPSVNAALRDAKPIPFNAARYRAEFTEKWNQTHEGDDNKPMFPAQQLEDEVKERQQEFQAQEASYKGRVKDIVRLVKEDKIKQVDASKIVYISWADKRDGTYAESWPEGVYHSWAEPMAVLKRQLTVVRQQAITDEDGHEVSEQKQDILVQDSKSPHIFGRDEDEKWFLSPAEQEEEKKQRVEPRTEQWEQSRREMVLKKMIELRADSIPKVVEDDVSSIAEDRTEQLASASATRLAQLEARYPEYKPWLDQLDMFSELITELEAARAKERNTPTGMSRTEVLNELEVLEKESHAWDSSHPGFLRVETVRQNLITEIESQTALLERAQLDGEDADEVEIERIKEQISELEAELIGTTAEVNEVKIDSVLSRHQYTLRDLGDEAAETAALTPRAARAEQRSQTEDKQIDESELADMGVHVDQTAPRKGVWGRIKGAFGR